MLAAEYSPALMGAVEATHRRLSAQLPLTQMATRREFVKMRLSQAAAGGAAASGGAGGTAALEAELSEYDATLVERLSTFEASVPAGFLFLAHAAAAGRSVTHQRGPPQLGRSH